MLSTYFTVKFPPLIASLFPERGMGKRAFDLFLDLPLDMQNVIVGFAATHFKDIAKLSRVNRHFHKLAWSSQTTLNFSGFVNARKLTAVQFLPILSEIGSRLREINLAACSGIDNTAFEKLAEAKNLQALDISRCRVLTTSLRVIGSMKHLKSLIIQDAEVRHLSIVLIRVFASLQNFGVGLCSLRREGQLLFSRAAGGARSP